MAKVLCVLYDDPVGGYPSTYARDDVPKLERYPLPLACALALSLLALALRRRG